MSSEVQSSLSLSLNTKSKLQTHSYETAGGSGVEGGEWAASHMSQKLLVGYKPKEFIPGL